MRISTVDRRQQLIAAAIRVLKRDGVENASLRTIAAEANASLAAVHVCFTNKDELMEATASELLRQLVEPVREHVSPNEDLRATAHKIVDFYWDHLVTDQMYALTQYELGTWSMRNPIHGNLLRIIYQNYESEIAELLETSAGRFNQQPTMPFGALARGLVAIIDGCTLQHLGNPSIPNHKQLCDALLDSFLTAAGI